MSVDGMGGMDDVFQEAPTGGYEPIGGSADTWGPRASDMPAPTQGEGGGWASDLGNAAWDKLKGAGQGIGDMAKGAGKGIADMFSNYGT